MAPTVPAAMTYSKEHLILTNKLRKPVVEKMRRDRINSSIEQLKSLLGPAFLQQQPDSKLEKADVLEMAVFFLKRQQQPVSSSSSPVSQGYSRCVQEIKHFLSREEVMSQSQKRLLNHFQNLPSSSDMTKSQSVLPQLNSPARQTTSKEETPVKGALWRPW
ncbi:transcription factor HES-5-like [Anguilla anguilla]|uniref:transcription factor HES-5-like n=1 Tax=Anguilla anguilla TaxID=7936 RepID=UPI0015AFC712|nr:transcription factor HES-5-like [Anguilla anguilla]XP_035243205.1 transcription factor HES-5-like [Anguilla anguilla]